MVWGIYTIQLCSECQWLYSNFSTPIEGITYGVPPSGTGQSVLIKFLRENNFVGTTSDGPVADNQGIWIASGRMAVTNTEYAYVFGLFVPTTSSSNLYAMTSQGAKLVVTSGDWFYSKITW